MSITKADIRAAIDRDNGKGYSSNINLNGYVFTKRNSFIVFELKNIEDVRVCHIKYIHWENERELMNILTCCCNFWMGNRVQFIFYKEKERKGGTVQYLKDLGFREEIADPVKWKWKFACSECGQDKCSCMVHSLYK